MQQASQASSGRLNSPGGDVLPTAVPDPAFVVNLCASTTPMALPRPDHPQLKRFTFFISRRREDGRERFRLHMGYFGSQEEAEQLLELVREIYPAAWAGVAPGQRLRAAAAGGMLAGGAAGTLPPPAVAAAGAQPAPAAPAVAAPPAQLATAAPAQPPARVVPPAAVRAPAAPAPLVAPAPTPKPPVMQSMHSVRAAIDALEESVPPRAPAPPARPAQPELRPVPVARPVTRVTAAPRAAPAPPSLTPRQVLGVLETPAAAPRAEVAGYAVQLMWSVQPIEMSGVPQLAIFSAYTLYGAAGNRDGRRWYGLRLGFFTDAVSAKQVANYVRSEFAAVSIVPVSSRERERALAAAPRTPLPEAPMAPKKAAVNIASSGEYRLLDEARVAGTPAPAAPARTTRGAPGKRAKLRPAAAGGNGAARPQRRPPLSLEETLEILGAGELRLQDGRDDPLNDSGVRHLRMEATKGRRASRFSKLMDRLSERFGGG